MLEVGNEYSHTGLLALRHLRIRVAEGGGRAEAVCEREVPEPAVELQGGVGGGEAKAGEAAEGGGPVRRMVAWLFGCRHENVTWPHGVRQACLDCGASRLYGFGEKGIVMGPWEHIAEGQEELSRERRDRGRLSGTSAREN